MVHWFYVVQLENWHGAIKQGLLIVFPQSALAVGWGGEGAQLQINMWLYCSSEKVNHDSHFRINYDSIFRQFNQTKPDVK